MTQERTRRTFLKGIGAAGVAALSGCATLDGAYGAHVEDGIEEDLSGLGPEETAEYFLMEQRDLDEAGAAEQGLLTGPIDVEIDGDGDSYDLTTTIDTHLTVVDDETTEDELHEAAAGRTYRSIVDGDEVIPRPDDITAYLIDDEEAEIYVATSEEDVTDALTQQFLEGVMLPYRALEGEGTNRPVARGQFIDTGIEMDAEPGTYTATVTADGAELSMEYTRADIRDTLDRRKHITTGDHEFVDGNVGFDYDA